MAGHNKTGKIGEQLAARYLTECGFAVVDTNYGRKWGELDLVAKRGGVIHFVEVKSTRNPKDERQPCPVERVDGQKVRRLARAVQTYAAECGVSLETGTWQCDICIVYIDAATQHADIDYIDNILLHSQ